ncbi:bifunctional 5,10-methylenetetrahydrofolate dehydrogenase/5,10-methenyltetrahydrofolate cyclohydrolase [Patescibacteria group bacterium]|nr:bifunctional 5,10-methylenetetrahydrofolate dehydrogenase/5,10-methenyltetrahydrofolate cyclohydrolase [Patescibacteria group bacterium]
MAKVINGRKLAVSIRENLKRKIARSNIRPGLAAILVGNNPASETYVGLKEKASAEVGVYFEKYLFPSKTTQISIIRKIQELNRDKKIHGILVQLPLPAHLNENKIIQAIDSKKDADGFHSENIKLFLKGKSIIKPGLAVGIVKLVESTKVSLKNKSIYILAKSPIFIDPLEKMFKEKGANVESGKKIGNMKKTDIIVVALGRPHSILSKHIKNGAIIIDVGYNRKGDKVLGDVHPSANKKAGYFTPVPGGVGPMTVAMLLENTYQLAKYIKSH